MLLGIFIKVECIAPMNIIQNVVFEMHELTELMSYTKICTIISFDNINNKC